MASDGPGHPGSGVRAVLTLGLTALVGLAASACGGGGTELSAGASDAQIEAGRATFERSCAACHGVEAGGTDQGPPLVHEVYEPGHHADLAFLVAVRNGVPEHHWGFGPMPPIAGVADDEVAEMVAYVRSLQRAAGIE